MKPHYSNDQGGQGVQAARLTGEMAVRDSKNPEGPAFTFSNTAWANFINAMTEG